MKSLAGEQQPLLILANPNAGNGKAYRRLSGSERDLPKGSQIVFSRNRGEIERLAFEASRDRIPIVVVVGGDGSIHEAVNGLMRNTENQTRLGIVALGTANDFAFSVAQQMRSSSIAKLKIDIGEVKWNSGHRFFCNVVGIGLTATVAKQSFRFEGLPSRLRYGVGLFRSAWSRFRCVGIQTRFDQEQEQKNRLLTLSIALGQREGGFRLAPQALLDDGQFDVLQVGGVSRVDLIRYFPGILRGKIPTSDSRITVRKCSQVSLSSEDVVDLHLDGELPIPSTAMQNSKIEIAIHHQKLEVAIFS